MAKTKTIRDLFAPAFWRAWNDIYYKRVGTVSCSGGRGCVDGSTIIYSRDGAIKIKDFKGGEVLALTDQGVRYVPACGAIAYDRVSLFKVSLQNGAAVVCTDQHRFLTKNGWKMLLDLSEGDEICLSSSYGNDISFSDLSIELSVFPTVFDGPRVLCCGENREESHVSVLHLTRRLLGLLYHYWMDYRRCDGQLPTDQETYLDVLQQLVYAPEHTHHLNGGGFGIGLGDIHCGLFECRQPKMDCPSLSSGKCCEDEGSRIEQMLSELLLQFVPSRRLCRKNEDHSLRIQQAARLLLASIADLSPLYEIDSVSSTGDCQEENSLRTLYGMLLRRVGDESFSSTLLNVDVHGRNPLVCNAIKSIQETGEDVYYDLFVPFYNNYVSEGGIINHNSTKSTFCADTILLRLEQSRREALALKAKGDPDWMKYLTHAACFRKVGGTLADSCFAQFEWCCNQLGLKDKYLFKKTPLSIERIGTHQRIYFRGLDDPMKARSLRSSMGYIRDLWFEELSEFDGIAEIQDVTRSVQRGGKEFMTFYSYNPPETSSNWVNFALAQLEEEDPTFRQYKSDYRSVPRDWLGDKFFRDAEILRRLNERSYRHVYLGEITGNGGTVFPNVRKVRISDDEIKRFDNILWGADFGLRDPTVLVGCQYDAGMRRLIIFDEVYQSDMTLDEILLQFSTHHFGYEYIRGDSAAAQLIVSLRAKGLPILPCEKGNGSILNQIKFLQSLTEICIDPKRCPNTYREFVNYEYVKNKMGQFTGALPDIDNHAVDATRYSIERLAKYDVGWN